MPAAERDGAPIADRELSALFQPFADFQAVLLAVSGGPDSTALLVLAQRWRAARRSGPRLIAATVDHRLRRESRAEAAGVARLARKLGVQHRTLAWSGRKPRTGLQEAAREARYALLIGLARSLKADAVATAHTLDDQAETVLMRLARGSGLAGLAGIRPRSTRDGVALLRPLLAIPKARLVATLRKAGIGYADDPSNRDPRFTRPRVRRIAAALAAEGLSAERIATLARRAARAERALEQAAERALAALAGPGEGPIEVDAGRLFGLPDELSLRVLGRALGRMGDEGPVELAKLEALHADLSAAYADGTRRRRTLAGAAVTLERGRLAVARAPARRKRRGR